MTTSIFNNSINTTTRAPPTLTPFRPKPYSNEFRILLLFLYCILLICGLLGNFLTCIAVITVKTMRRSIHFYIFNLATADLLLLLLYVPTQMIFVRDYMSWTMGKNMCIIAFGIICLCLSASIGTLIAISIDRYTGLMRPFDWRAASTRTSKIVIPVIWVMSALTAAPLAYHGNVGRNRDGSTVCYEDWSLNSMVIYWSAIMVAQYILPLILITGVHIHMAVIVSRQKQEAINELHQRMIRMVIMLLFTYSICNGMQHINFYLSVYLHIHNESFGTYLFLFSNFAISLQAAINPLIYGISRNDYNNVFKTFFKSYTLKVMKVVCRVDGHKQQQTHVDTNSNNTDLQPIMETPQLLKKNFQTTSLLVTNNNREIFEMAPSVPNKDTASGLKQIQTSPYLQIPKRQTRKISLRFDTLRYMPDEDSNVTRTRTRTRSGTKKHDNLANEMVPQLITSNQNHPIIVITDFEKNNGDPEGKYGTIKEYDYQAVNIERPSNGFHAPPPRALQERSNVDYNQPSGGVDSDFDFSWSMINPNSRESVIIDLLTNANESIL